MAELKNPIATITNNSGVDVDIYDVFNNGDINNPLLSYTKLGTVKQGATGEIQTSHLISQLQAMYTGAISAMGGKYYTQFPVAVMAISSIGTHKHTSCTITADDKSGMEKSFLFQRYITANPDSKIAKDFATAIADPDRETAVNKFFAATQNFTTCTLPKWTAVVAWLGQFSSAWQGMYYLYSVPPKDSTTAPTLVAAVNISTSASSDTATLSMAGSSQSTTLAMNGLGFQESNLGEGDISVSLKPAWINLIQSDTSGSPVYAISNALGGVVNGTTVFGTGVQRADSGGSGKPGDKPDQPKTPQQDSQDSDRLFNKITTLAGLAIGVLTAYLFWKQIQSGHTQAANKAGDDAAKKGGDGPAVDSAMEKVKVANEKALSQSKEAAAAKDAVAKAAEEVGPSLREIALQKQVDELQGKINSMADKLDDALEVHAPSAPDLELAQNLSDAQSKVADLQAASAPDLAALDAVKSSVQDMSSQLDVAIKAGNAADPLAPTRQAIKQELDAASAQADAVANAEAARNENIDHEPSAPEVDDVPPPPPPDDPPPVERPIVEI